MSFYNDDIKILDKKDYPKKESKPSKVYESIKDLFDKLDLKDGITVSSHHHLRNGDAVLNMMMLELQRRGIKDITLVASSLFPVHKELIPLLEDGTITNIITSYISGDLAKAISKGKLKGKILMQSHGGRARSIIDKNVVIDYAFIAAPSCDPMGNISGVNGEASCGSMGYAIADAIYAKKKIAITDTIVAYPNYPRDITEDYVDYILKVDSIGDKNGIVSGTTKVTKDPVGLKIAKDTLKVMKASGLLKDGFSYQSGAGGISLAVTDFLRDYMIKENIKGSFASGGITGYLTDMLEEGLFTSLYDVQCFDLKAIESIKKNANHLRMSGSEYGNPEVSAVVDNLDVVILGATEIDLDFNVNVITGADGVLMGGSGGHQDTAAGAKMSIIVSKLFSSRLPVIKNRVDVIATPGTTIDVLVTERGIAVNPLRQDLIEKFKENDLNVMTIQELKAIADNFMGEPKEIKKKDRIIGYSEYRDGSILDEIHEV
ncbi:citrate lyase subunit alpha [Fenollaria massiliensis]|uniref:Citrate lyase alpha chain n=1 Tax=Fenollaria massiliensis TaxID=938288 RepID=A0A9E7DL37_9FIRM|nr:citrate lyase subunit alpha [Fenollaria massiliensis]UQK59837.1 citrate lyase subunit alpha [Fenollaria massiliensis]